MKNKFFAISAGILLIFIVLVSRMPGKSSTEEAKATEQSETEYEEIEEDESAAAPEDLSQRRLNYSMANKDFFWQFNYPIEGVQAFEDAFSDFLSLHGYKDVEAVVLPDTHIERADYIEYDIAITGHKELIHVKLDLYTVEHEFTIKEQ